MKRIRIILIALAVISFAGISFTYAQSKIPKKDIPSAIPADVRKEIERFYSTDPVERAYGAYSLGKMGEKAAAAARFLAELLDDNTALEWNRPDTPYGRRTSPRTEAQETLVKMGTPAIISLIETLKDKNSYIQSISAKAIIIIGKPAVEPLIETLRDESVLVRKVTAEVLGKISDIRAIEPLIEVLKDREEGVRENAAWALKKITGQDLGGDPMKWAEWWEKNKGK